MNLKVDDHNKKCKIKNTCNKVNKSFKEAFHFFDPFGLNPRRSINHSVMIFSTKDDTERKSSLAARSSAALIAGSRRTPICRQHWMRHATDYRVNDLLWSCAVSCVICLIMIYIVVLSVGLSLNSRKNEHSCPFECVYLVRLTCYFYHFNHIYKVFTI